MRNLRSFASLRMTGFLSRTTKLVCQAPCPHRGRLATAGCGDRLLASPANSRIGLVRLRRRRPQRRTYENEAVGGIAPYGPYAAVGVTRQEVFVRAEVAGPDDALPVD